MHPDEVKRNLGRAHRGIERACQYLAVEKLHILGLP